MSIITVAWILLTFRIISLSIILYIIFNITYPNLRAENDLNVLPVRWVLFAISLLLLLGNIIPVVVDIATLLGGVTDRASELGFVLSTYTLNNAISDAIQSAGFLLLFIVSEKANVRLQARNKMLQDDKDALRKL